MSPLEVGILGLIVLFILLAMGMPIGISMGLVGIVGFGVLTSFDAAMSKFSQTAFSMTTFYPRQDTSHKKLAYGLLGKYPIKDKAHAGRD